MGKNPAFLLYPADWTRDLEEHPLEIEGAWIRICCKLWWSETRGISTKSLSQWARILGTHHNKTRVILNYLSENKIGNVDFLDNQNVTITSRRMVKDEKIRQIRREVGKLGGNPKLKVTSENLDNQNHGSSVSVSVSVSKQKKKTTSFVLPEWIPTDLWQAYLEVRKKKRATTTEKALNLCMSTINKLHLAGHNRIKVIEQSVERGWVGFFELKDGGNGLGHATKYQRQDYRGKTDREYSQEVLDTIDRAKAAEREWLLKHATENPSNNKDQ